MWSDNEQPAVSLETLCLMSGRPVREIKAQLEEYWRFKEAQALRVEKKAAAMRHRQGPRRVVEALGDAHPLVSMSKFRWLQYHRASKIERGDRGGSLLSEESDFISWLLKKPEFEHLRVPLAKITNKVGWTAAEHRMANAADWGRRERNSQTLVTAA